MHESCSRTAAMAKKEIAKSSVASLQPDEILGKTNSQIEAIDVGFARIQLCTVELVHVVDLKRYVALMNHIYSLITENVSISHPLDTFLIHQAKQMQMYLDYFKPLNKRSLNFIGSTWKWMVGNPDLVILEQKITHCKKIMDK
uniref:Uncharacterized protein n=1 Tax=Glossina austeni TaxID=7395 RepID=A0A1A9VL48_GLOAU